MTVKTVNSFQQFLQSVAERHRDDAVPLWKPNWADSMLMHPAFTLRTHSDSGILFSGAAVQEPRGRATRGRKRAAKRLPFKSKSTLPKTQVVVTSMRASERACSLFIFKLKASQPVDCQQQALCVFVLGASGSCNLHKIATYWTFPPTLVLWSSVSG